MPDVLVYPRVTVPERVKMNLEFCIFVKNLHTFAIDWLLHRSWRCSF